MSTTETAQAQAKLVKKDLYWVGVHDIKLRVFDIIMRTPYGTTYNSFLLRGTKATVLLETAKEPFWKEYEQRIDSVIGHDGKVDYIVLNHTEPDHSGSLVKLLDRWPTVTVVATESAIHNLARITHREFKKIVLTAELSPMPTIDVGGYVLRFIISPWLHWPDTMFTYIEGARAIVTCDFFGAHYSNPKIFNDLMTEPQEIHDVPDAYKYYFDCIFSPYRQWVLKGLDNIKDLDFDVICCSHGPVLRTDLPRYIEMYRKWAQPPVIENRVVIAYVSAYKYTKELADTIAASLEREGVGSERYDLVETPVEELMVRFDLARGLLLGTPTIVGEALPPIWDVTSRLNPVIHADRVFGVFGSYGWSGQGTANVMARIDQLKCKAPLEPFTVIFRANAEDHKRCAEWAIKFARAVKGEPVNERETAAAPTTGGGKLALKSLSIPRDGKLRRWRCIVCGEVIVSVLPPETCPACGARAEAFVCLGLAEAEATAEVRQKTAFAGKVVIVGAGGAALAAAKAMREFNDACSIALVTKEAERPYYRPSLTKLLGDPAVRSDPAFRLAPDEWYAQQRVTVSTSAEVTSVDTAAHTATVRDRDGQRVLQYDKLILATGGNNFVPVPDLPAGNVFGVRLASDIDAITAFLARFPGGPAHARVVIIGGGLAALETAAALRKLGAVSISMVEMVPRILPRQLSEEASRIYQGVLGRAGVKLFLGTTCGRVDRNGDRAVGVTLCSGDHIELDLLCFSIGTVPDVALAKSIGCKVNRGIVVDDAMRTSVDGVFACGDCTEFSGRNIPNWTEASGQGRVAGLQVVGATSAPGAKFVRQASPYFLDAFLDVFSVGQVDACPSKVSHRGEGDRLLELCFGKGRTLIGAIILGDWVRDFQTPITLAVNKAMPFAEAMEFITAVNP